MQRRKRQLHRVQRRPQRLAADPPHLRAGVDFSYNAWAAHPGWFYVYVTKDGFDPTRTLTWDDMEDQPFLTVDHPPLNGSPGTVEANYSWTGQLPSGKSGRHIIYMVWQRSDSAETFYSCSDVVFDGGNGEVTGIHEPGNPSEPVPGTCTATRRTTGSWNGGYQSEVTVTNSGDVPMLGWMVDWTAGRAVGGQSLERQRHLQRPGGDGPQRRLERFAESGPEHHIRLRRHGLRR